MAAQEPAPQQGTSRVQLFGREPAAWVGLIEGTLAFVVGAKLLDLSTDQVGGIMAVVTALAGVYTAYVTRDTLLGVAIGLVKALVTAGIAFGLDLPTDQTGALIAFATVLLGFFQRTQTSPIASPSFSSNAATPALAY
jgi:hypothetical protein